MSFCLHERLAADTIHLGQSGLCEIRLMNDSTWPWVLLVPRRAGIRELYELNDADQWQLLRESSALGRAMMAGFSGDKLNLAALGNRVPQLHLHHIVRFVEDAFWPDPVWGKQSAVAYSKGLLAQRLEVLGPVLAAVKSV